MKFETISIFFSWWYTAFFVTLILAYVTVVKLNITIRKSEITTATETVSCRWNLKLADYGAAFVRLCHCGHKNILGIFSLPRPPPAMKLYYLTFHFTNGHKPHTANIFKIYKIIIILVYCYYYIPISYYTASI